MRDITWKDFSPQHGRAEPYIGLGLTASLCIMGIWFPHCLGMLFTEPRCHDQHAVRRYLSSLASLLPQSPAYKAFTKCPRQICLTSVTTGKQSEAPSTQSALMFNFSAALRCWAPTQYNVKKIKNIAASIGVRLCRSRFLCHAHHFLACS